MYNLSGPLENVRGDGSVSVIVNLVLQIRPQVHSYEQFLGVH